MHRDTLAFGKACRDPETKGGLRQLTLLLLVSAGIQRRVRREPQGLALDPGPARAEPQGHGGEREFGSAA